MISLISVSPSDPTISTMSEEISSSSVTCSASQLTDISLLVSGLQLAVGDINQALVVVISQLEGELGSMYCMYTAQWKTKWTSPS